MNSGSRSRLLHTAFNSPNVGSACVAADRARPFATGTAGRSIVPRTRQGTTTATCSVDSVTHPSRPSRDGLTVTSNSVLAPERFVDDDQANAMLLRAMRPPWSLI